MTHHDELKSSWFYIDTELVKVALKKDERNRRRRMAYAAKRAEKVQKIMRDKAFDDFSKKNPSMLAELLYKYGTEEVRKALEDSIREIP